MAYIHPFEKFDQTKVAWGSYQPVVLGAHIEYCESHIDACEQLIANQNGNGKSFFIVISMHIVSYDSI